MRVSLLSVLILSLLGFWVGLFVIKNDEKGKNKLFLGGDQGDPLARSYFVGTQGEQAPFFWKLSGFLGVNELFHFPQEASNQEDLYLYRVRLTQEASLRKDLAELLKSSDVLFVEPERLHYPSHYRSEEAKTPHLNSLNLYENSRYFWWQRLAHFDNSVSYLKNHYHSLQLAPSVKGPIVAVMDGGVDYEHPALKSKMWINPLAGEMRCGKDLHGCCTIGADHESLGSPHVYPFGLQGPDKICTELGPAKPGDCSHGTHVAGVIAAESREFGMIGLCPMCRIMSLKVMESIGGEAAITDFAILNALKYVALVNEKTKDPVRIINASFGKFERSRAVTLMINYLRKTYQTLVFAAAGNEDTFKRSFPGGQRNVFSVGALDAKGRRTHYSNYGPWVNLYAPGGGFLSGVSDFNSRIRSTEPGDSYGLSQGTSVAAPIVSGVAGFFLSMDPSLTAQQIERILRRDVPTFKKVQTLDVEESLKFYLAGEHHKEEAKHKNEPLCGAVFIGTDLKPFQKGPRLFSLFLLFLSPVIALSLAPQFHRRRILS